MQRIIRSTFIISATAGLLVSGCASTRSGAGDLAKTSGRAALRAVGVEVKTPQPEENADVRTAAGKDPHWSEQWVWGEEPR